jgi:hypothetical protein
MYRLYDRQKSKQHRFMVGTALTFVFLLMVSGGVLWARDTILHPNAVISQSSVVTTHVSYTNPTKTYTEPDFSIQIPSTWQLLPRPVGPYQSYTWQSADRETDGQEIEIYEDTIPINVAVNRVLVVQAENTQLELDGTASANCSTFTKNPALANSTGAPAEWNGVSFLCDQVNQQRDVIGTSSSEGVNTVTLKDPTSGTMHKFFFTYTDESINPDYTLFYDALESFRLN